MRSGRIRSEFLHQLTDRDLAAALDVGRARLEAQHVVLVELELGGVLDGDDALVVRDEARQHVEQVVVFPEPVPPEMMMLRRPRTQAASKSRTCGVKVPKAMRSLSVNGSVANFRMVSMRAVEGDRRDDRVDTRAVGQAGVHQRAGLVDAAADATHDLVDGAPQVGVGAEAGLDREELAGALDEDVSPVR